MKATPMFFIAASFLSTNVFGETMVETMTVCKTPEDNGVLNSAKDANEYAGLTDRLISAGKCKRIARGTAVTVLQSKWLSSEIRPYGETSTFWVPNEFIK